MPAGNSLGVAQTRPQGQQWDATQLSGMYQSVDSEAYDYPDPILNGHMNGILLNDHDGRTAYRHFRETRCEHSKIWE